MRPVLLPPNGVPRFYRGGPAITALRGVRFEGDRVPEEWIGSTASVFGEGELGLSRLPDGTLLRDAIRAAPEDYLGPAHVARFGPDPALLVKLLDAGERLPVHVHPDGAFAGEHLGTRFGKTEAWIVVGADRPGHRGARRLARGRRRRHGRGLGARPGPRRDDRRAQPPPRRPRRRRVRPRRRCRTRSAKGC